MCACQQEGGPPRLLTYDDTTSDEEPDFTPCRDVPESERCRDPFAETRVRTMTGPAAAGGVAWAQEAYGGGGAKASVLTALLLLLLTVLKLF